MSIECVVADPKKAEEELVAHLRANKVYEEGRQLWTVQNSSLGGRGLIATRDIDQGELIYIDAPLLVGPRCVPRHLPMCAVCYKNECPLFPCDNGCGLPICSTECEKSTIHAEQECKYLRSLIPTCGTDWSTELLLAVIPVRALFMTKQQRNCMAVFEYHKSAKNGLEVDLLCRNVAKKVPEEDIEFMKYVCGMFNTNSFETVSVQDQNHSTSLRALYPMGALENHECVPNTTHHFDGEYRLYVSATRAIHVGEEITMAYTSLFWDTTLRRQFLNVTKHFWCSCKRCSDSTELGTKLGALFCAADNCHGILLPKDSLKLDSSWICDKCGLTIKSRQIASIRSGLAAIVEETRYKTPRQILRFMQGDLADVVPESNYLMADMKFRIISYFGRCNGIAWHELTDNELKVKRSYCFDLLDILDALGCGDCKKRGLILYELYCTNIEQMRRFRAAQDNRNRDFPDFPEVDLIENEKLLETATNILKNDILSITMQESDELFGVSIST